MDADTNNETTLTHRTPRTHRDLIPRGMCPSLMMKRILTHGMDDELIDDRELPGDGYYWCLCTCKEVGPDDELCDPRSCLPGRACYDGPRS